RIVDRDHRAGIIHPPAEVTVVHARQRNGGIARVVSSPVAEALVRYKKERFVFSVVHLGNVYRATESEAEIVLLQHGRALSKEAARVSGVIAQKLECIAVHLIRAGLSRE